MGGKAVECNCKQRYLPYKTGSRIMKKSLIFILMVSVASALLAYTFYKPSKPHDKRFIFSDLTVKDKKTGLIWTREANIADREMTWDDACRLIEDLNEQKYAGHSDWRLPTKDELGSLLGSSANKNGGVNYLILFNKSGFKNVQAYGYWSSTTDAGDTAFAWDVFMCGGGVLAFSRTFPFYVWPVRAG